MCRRTVHEEAVKKVLPDMSGNGMDAAAVIVVKRLEDAVRDGENILCTIDSVSNLPPTGGSTGFNLGNHSGHFDVSKVIGYSHAASGMLNLAAGILMISGRFISGWCDDG